MQDDLFPITLPPGLFRNGTRYQSAGRWYDANLIRFQGPRIQPIGGWRPAPASTGGDVQALTGVGRGIHGWSANSGSLKLGIGTHLKAYALIDGTLTDITPASGFTAGNLDGSYAGGSGAFGSGAYGSGAYGTGALTATLVDADTWSMDNFGDLLVGCLTSDGKILIWDGNTNNNFAAAAGAPTSCAALVVTPERFLVALGAGGNKRKVQWPDQETSTLWTPGPLVKAGSFEIATNGRLRCGARTKSETLLWTDADLWTMNFIGGTLVYSFRQAGDKCGIVGPNAKVVLGSRAFWMGKGKFFAYNGTVQPLPCDVQDYVFSDFNEAQVAKVYGLSFAKFGEVAWFYCSANAVEIDRYVVYNYEENHWNTGRLVRTAGIDAGSAPNPVLIEAARAALGTLTSTGTNVSNGHTVTIASKVYTFQTVLTNVDGNVFIGATAAASLQNLFDAINLTGTPGTQYATLMTVHPTAQAETVSATTIGMRAKVSGTSGNTIATTETSTQLSWGAATLLSGGAIEGYPVANLIEHEIGNDRGSEVPYIESGPYELDGGNHIMGIYRIVPDELNLGDVQAYIYTSLDEAPTAVETLNGPYAMTSPTDVRLTARIARVRFQQAIETAWRIGVMRFGMKQKGRR